MRAAVARKNRSVAEAGALAQTVSSICSCTNAAGSIQHPATPGRRVHPLNRACRHLHRSDRIEFVKLKSAALSDFKTGNGFRGSKSSLTTQYTYPMTAEETGLVAIGGAFAFFYIALLVFFIVCGWKIYTKAGQPG
jgi:hypothetical protein